MWQKSEAYNELINRFKEVEPNATRETTARKINSYALIIPQGSKECKTQEKREPKQMILTNHSCGISTNVLPRSSFEQS